MVVIAKTLFMRDLRGNWVFPRLVYATTGQALDRGIHGLVQSTIRCPADRLRNFFFVLRDRESFAGILLAGFAVLVSFVKALTYLLLSIGALYLVIFRL